MRSAVGRNPRQRFSRAPAARRPESETVGESYPVRRSTRLVEGQSRTAPATAPRSPERKTMSANVAHLGSARASAVRADRRRTVSGDVRRDSRIWLSHPDSVGPSQMTSGNRTGLQAGGHRFDPGTLHLEKGPFAALLSSAVPSPATAVRARCERTCRPVSVGVERGQVRSRCRREVR
jgi:hypothetical protein